MPAMHFCKGWWMTGRGDSALVHLRSEDGHEVVVWAATIQKALKRRKTDGGLAVFCGRQIRDGRLIVAVCKRTNTLGVVIPANWDHPVRLLTISAQEVPKLRDAVVRKVDGWKSRANETTTGPVGYKATGS